MPGNGRKHICPQCDRNRDFLRIVRKMLGAITGQENIQQGIAEELTDILGLERCVVFRIKKTPSESEICHIIAGTPAGEHDLTFSDPLTNHPDLAAVYASGEIMHITDPRDNKLTRYFRHIIWEKKINQILYLPLNFGYNVRKVRGIIVLDTIGTVEFSAQDIDFCFCIGQLISDTLNREDILHQQWKDRLLNPASALGGFANRISKKVEQISAAVEEITKDSKRIEELFEQDRARQL